MSFFTEMEQQQSSAGIWAGIISFLDIIAKFHGMSKGLEKVPQKLLALLLPGKLIVAGKNTIYALTLQLQGRGWGSLLSPEMHGTLLDWEDSN